MLCDEVLCRDLKLLGIRPSNKCCDSSQGPVSGIINPEATERISLFKNDIDITFLVARNKL